MNCSCASCRRRASWTPRGRARFDSRDRRAEAIELTENFRIADLAAPDPGTAPFFRKGTPDLRGRVFGELRVEALVYRRRSTGKTRRWWRLRCSCGKTSHATSDELLRRNPQHCRSCAARLRDQANMKRVNGLTVGAIAAISGASKVTIRRRMRGGWPLEDLLLPPVPPRGRVPAGTPTRRVAA